MLSQSPGYSQTSPGKTSWKHVDGGAPTHGLILVAMSEAPGGTGSIGKLHRRDAVAILEMTRESALIAKSDSCRRLRN
jgi:hypothetical protein